MKKVVISLLFVVFAIQAIAEELPPEALMNFTQYCEYYNYPVTAFDVTTQDGYIITIFRVQAKGSEIVSGKKPVILQHGLLQTSDEWIINSEDKAPGLILANKGFDVWATNVRGNRYGLRNVKYTTTQSEFWEFNFDQMAEYDLSAHFEFVHNITGFNKIDYIGHSQGTLIMFIALSTRQPTVMKYVGKYVALAPIVYIQNMKNAVLKAVSGWKYTDALINYLGIENFLPYNEKTSQLLATFCSSNIDVCKEVFGNIIGGDPDLVNYDRIPIFLGHAPGGTSSQNMFHFQQYIVTGEFKMYDYGSKKLNKQHYNQEQPPFYDLNNIDKNIYLFGGYLDSLADPIDVENLYHILLRRTNSTLQYVVQGHSSFVIGNNMTYFSEVVDILSSN